MQSSSFPDKRGAGRTSAVFSSPIGYALSHHQCVRRVREAFALLNDRHCRFFTRGFFRSQVIGVGMVCLAALVILSAGRLAHDWRSSGPAPQVSVAGGAPLPPPAAPIPLREVLGGPLAPIVKAVAFNSAPLVDSGDYRRRQMLEMWVRTGAIQYDAPSGVRILRPHLDTDARRRSTMWPANWD
jgi:hypothetical protein